MGGKKFNPDRAAGILTNSLRRLLLSPERVLSDIGINSGEIWSDIGCGNGFFTIPMSKRAARVLAVDISDKMLEMLEKTIKLKQADTVETIKSEENIIPIQNESVDGLFLSFVAHELDTPEVFFPQLVKCLKPGGRLVVIEFTKTLSIGPPMHERVTPQQVDEWAINAGLKKGSVWKWTRSVIGLEYLHIK